jgi:hypothetical protein
VIALLLQTEQQTEQQMEQKTEQAFERLVIVGE